MKSLKRSLRNTTARIRNLFGPRKVPVEIGTLVDAGGCVGKIVQFDENIVAVEGVYVYYSGDDDEPGYEESWRFRYARSEFDKIKRRNWSPHDKAWDASKLKHVNA